MILTDDGAWRAAMRQARSVKRVLRQDRLVAVLVLHDDDTADVFDPTMGWCGRFRSEREARKALKLLLEDAA
jgi:hypothetical protein